MSIGQMSRTGAVTAAAVFVAMPLMASAPPGPTVIYVDDDADLGGDGWDWETAYKFLQDALANSVSGTEIHVAQGTYTPDHDEGGNVTPGDREASFELVDGVSLFGGFAGVGSKNPDERDPELYETVLSGDLLGDDGPDFANNEENSYRVVNGTSVAVHLDGLTIRAGNADGSASNDVAAGLLVALSDLTLNQCSILSNSALEHAAGIGAVNESNVELTDCVFIGNGQGELVTIGGGGGIYSQDSDLLLVDCYFEDNHHQRGGAVASWHFSTAKQQDLTLINCTLIGNTARFAGGAVSLHDVVATFVNCEIVGNETWDDIGQGGGGIGAQSNDDLGSSSTLINVRLTGNHAVQAGGGFWNDGAESSFNMVNCTVSGNSTDGLGGGIWHDGGKSSGAITNSLLWGNSDVTGMGEAAQIHAEFSFFITLDYSSVQGLSGAFGGTGNIDADPLFADPLNGDYRLLSGSPCIDAGDNTAIPLRSPDLDGNPRLVDDPATGDTGFPVGWPGPIVDMGAYEYQRAP
jgi:hypothetical protein